MRECSISREQALALLKTYNSEPFHLRHALTVEGVMRHFARERGFAEEEDFWAMAGLLHEIDFERYPEEHCRKAPELLREGGVGEDMIHAVCSHGYGLCCDVEPEQERLILVMLEIPTTGAYTNTKFDIARELLKMDAP